MICLVYFKTDGWPWIHLDEAGSSGSEVVAGRYAVLSLRCRAWGFFSGCYACDPQLLSKENRRKVEPKETARVLIPHLLVVFTQQLEILATTLRYKC